MTSDEYTPLSSESHADLQGDRPVVVSCEFIHRNLPAILDGEMDGLAIQNHLRDCEKCREALRLERKWSAVVRQSLKQSLAAPAEARQRLAEAVESGAFDAPTPRRSSSPSTPEIGGVRPALFVPLGMVAALLVGMFFLVEPTHGLAADATRASSVAHREMRWRVPAAASPADYRWVMDEIRAAMPNSMSGGAEWFHGIPDADGGHWRFLGATDRTRLDGRPAVSLVYSHSSDPTRRCVLHWMPWRSRQFSAFSSTSEMCRFEGKQYLVARIGVQMCVAWKSPFGPATCVLVLPADFAAEATPQELAAIAAAFRQPHWLCRAASDIP